MFVKREPKVEHKHAKAKVVRYFRISNNLLLSYKFESD